MKPVGAGASRKVAIGIIAKDEEASISRVIASLAEQTLFRSNCDAEIIVYANGCSDQTATAARKAAHGWKFGGSAKFKVLETSVGGKSRTWNRLVHQAAPADADYIIFIDADILLARRDACLELVERLDGDPVALACTGRPTKALERLDKQSIVDRASLAVSEDGRAPRAINGSLYCLRGHVARAIWLPDQTPGEDGFLNAMVRTGGFSHPDRPELVAEAAHTTHYYEAVDIRGSLRHEQRMIVATMINIWVFEHFQALSSTTSVAPLIDEANRSDPNWVDRLIEQKARSRFWLVRNYVFLRRLPSKGAGGVVTYLSRLPLALAATAFSGLAAWRANQILRRRGAASYW